MGTPFSNTQQRSHTMKFFAVIPAILAAAAAEAQLPIAAQYLGGAGLYNGAYGYAAPYAAGYAAGPVATAVDAKFAYGAPITALNAGPLTAGPVAAAPALAATAPIVGAQYAAAYTPALAAVPAAYAGYAAAPAAYAAAPVAVAAAPVAYAAAAAPIAGPVSSQFQAQDEFGNLSYGYQNINSAKQEQGNAYGGVTGSYTYADEAGVHTVNYVADDFGFRVAGDNLPVAPVYNAALPVAPVHLAAPVVDTPEVAEAKAAFFAAFEAEASRTKRSAQLGAFGPTAYAGLATGLLPAAPVAAAAYAAPAAAAPAREAVLTTIKLNPGHAVFYRVD